MSNMDVDPLPPANAGRNNGPVAPSARKRNRISSKNLSNMGMPGQHSSIVTSSDEGGSSDESSGDEMQVTDENTLRQLRHLQDQVKFLRNQFSPKFSFRYSS
jgi:hypothetical protein